MSSFMKNFWIIFGNFLFWKFGTISHSLRTSLKMYMIFGDLGFTSSAILCYLFPMTQWVFQYYILNDNTYNRVVELNLKPTNHVHKNYLFFTNTIPCGQTEPSPLRVKSSCLSPRSALWCRLRWEVKRRETMSSERAFSRESPDPPVFLPSQREVHIATVCQEAQREIYTILSPTDFLLPPQSPFLGKFKRQGEKLNSHTHSSQS